MTSVVDGVIGIVVLHIYQFHTRRFWSPAGGDGNEISFVVIVLVGRIALLVASDGILVVVVGPTWPAVLASVLAYCSEPVWYNHHQSLSSGI